MFEYEFRLLDGVRDNQILNKEISENEELKAGHSYKLGWPRTTILPEKHTAYAYQWFALAIVLLLLATSATYKIRSENKR